MTDSPPARRTQAERTASTRASLVAAATPLFAARGYAEVGTDEIARSAGVTRGALYHQFDGKAGLFEAVLEEVERDLVATVSAALDAETDPLTALTAGIDAWLAASADPVKHRITLVEAPVALGWERWREIGHRHVLGLVEETLARLRESGALHELPVQALAHLLVGALGEGALYVAAAPSAQDATAARAEVRAAVLGLVTGLVRA